ncbi:PTS system mannose/fructose/sorbose family transporter subunit IID, partial [Salmonella enterica subsp. enterica serovar Kentucky]|nr:PTS system mannose/fructose/sorbose family transporter subunit IID [Salmonella enterica subsp. enterica serovar Kentucky]
LGITVAMEEKNSQQKEMDASSIDNVKASLMGPLAGIGDSFFWVKPSSVIANWLFSSRIRQPAEHS